MIYDTPITVLRLHPDTGTPLQKKLQQEFSAYCGPMTVFHGRFFEAIQAGTQIDRMVELPLHQNVDAGMFARMGGHIYRVEQAQFEQDENRLPVTRLSLRRFDDRYDIAGL